MRISVNLATRPFVELRPFFARLRIIMGALALLAIALGVVLHVQRRKLEAAESQMDDLRLRTVAAQNEKLRNENQMRQPANAAVLDRARFLNALFLRKSFSWTAVMMDLENVLPTGVQVSSILPTITTDGQVVIQLRVSGDRDRAIQLVRNLERSSRFLAPQLVGEHSQAKEGTSAAAGAAPPGVDFDIVANYNPLPDFAATKAAAKKIAGSGATNPTAPAKQRVSRPGPHDGVVLKPFVSVRPAASSSATPTTAPASANREKTLPLMGPRRVAGPPAPGGPR